MQQEKRRRVFRAGLSVEDGEPVYLYRAIKSRVFAIFHIVRTTRNCCFAAHHARVSLAGFFERIGFDHRPHAGQFGEAQCVLGIGWLFPRPSLESFDFRR